MAVPARLSLKPAALRRLNEDRLPGFEDRRRRGAGGLCWNPTCKGAVCRSGAPPPRPHARPVAGGDGLSLCSFPLGTQRPRRAGSASWVLQASCRRTQRLLPSRPILPECTTEKSPFSLPRLFSQPHPHLFLPQGKTNRYQTSGPEGAVVGAKPPPGGPHLPPGPCLRPAVLLLTGVDGVASDSRSCSHRHRRCDLGTCGTSPGVDGSSERSSTQPPTRPENSAVCARLPGRLRVLEKRRLSDQGFLLAQPRRPPGAVASSLSLSVAFPCRFPQLDFYRAFSWSKGSV